MTIVEAHDLEILADYHQIHLSDTGYDGDPGDLWTEEAVADMIAVGQGIVMFGTVRDMEVKVRVEIHQTRPAIVEDDWDQIVESHVATPSGSIRVMSCSYYEPDAFTVDVPSPGMSVRILSADLASLDEDGVEGDDHYVIQMWPGEPRGTTHAKRWRKPE